MTIRTIDDLPSLPSNERLRLFGPPKKDPGQRKSSAQSMADRRKRLAAAGLCIVCAKAPATPGPRGGTKYCDPCRNELAAINARRRGRTQSTPRQQKPPQSRQDRPQATKAPESITFTAPDLRTRLRQAREREQRNSQ